MNPRLSLIVVIFVIIKLGSCVPIESLSSQSSETESSISHESTTSSSVSSSSPSPSSSSHSHSSPASISAAHERTLLITQKWLIDNINLLRREMNEMARDYNQHIDANKQEAIRKEAEFARDVDSLRADHTLLARNQLQIINLIKNQHQQPTSSINSNENANNIESNSDSANHHHRKNLRHLVYDLIKEEANFESETKHNLSSLTTQLTDLHQITLSLYRDLKELKKRIQSVDFN